MKLPLFFTLLYGTAVSAAYVIDEIVPGKAEMVSADRVHGHEWAVFWRLVDTELSFDLYVHWRIEPPGVLATHITTTPLQV